MITLKSLALRRGTRLLLDQVNLSIHPGQKVGVTGANGCGKSSLFSMLMNGLQPDAGEISIPASWVMAHVAQETPSETRTALEFVLDGDEEMREVQKALEDHQLPDQALAELHGRFDTMGGYQAPSRAGRLMHGLGFEARDQERSVAEFSGGWRMRLNLARALMCRSDLLLLDEPTNHLDLEAVLWLQDWLCAYPGTLLLISHDRDFLDFITNHILQIENQTARLYAGNYSAFEVRRAEMLAQQQSAHEKQQRELAHIRSFVDRFRAQATKARQVQSRLKALERMETIGLAHADTPYDFEFPLPDKLPRPLLVFRDVSLGYGERILLKDLNITLMPGERIALLGPNGAGKSTLIKALAGVLELNCGERVKSPDLKLGYFAQHQIDELELDSSPLRHLQDLDRRASEKELRNFLGGFGFQGEQALSPVRHFSGGEKARLALAMLIYRKPNLLLLDEPTNHLDLDMRFALCRALQNFAGALVVVSHDRFLLRSISDTFWRVIGGKVLPYSGDLEDYRRQLAEPGVVSDAPETMEKSSSNRKEQRRLDAERREQLRPLRQALQDAEKRIQKIHLQRNEMEGRLADPDLYEDANQHSLQRLLKEKHRLEQDLSAAELDWLEAGEALESAEKQLAA